MYTEDIDQIVHDIVSDMYRKGKVGKVDPDRSAAPDLEDVFEELIHEEDETSKQVMRKIWKELQETRRVRR